MLNNSKLLDCIGNSGVAFLYKDDLYVRMHLDLENQYFLKIDTKGVYGISPVKDHDFYYYMKVVDPSVIFSYVNFGTDVQFIYNKDSYVYQCYLSTYNPSEVTLAIKSFISTIINQNEILTKTINYLNISSLFV